MVTGDLPSRMLSAKPTTEGIHTALLMLTPGRFSFAHEGIVLTYEKAKTHTPTA